MTAFPIRVASFYRFTRLADVAALRDSLEGACRSAGVRGTILLAREGINATIAGDDAAVDLVLAHVRTFDGCGSIETRESRAEAIPFHRLKVRIKREIVTMGEPDVDASAQSGHYVEPADWNALIDDSRTIVIDTRNDYEVAIGSFAGAINPGTRHFRDFPAWFRTHQQAVSAKGHTPRIAMFCTGGIRCEKATAFVKAQGIDEIYHLKGGILGYLETIPPEQSRWTGECFVFDARVALGHACAPGSHDLCHGCRMPIGAEDRASPLFRDGVSCPACHGERSDEQRAGYAERHRQTRLAATRGHRHVGAVFGGDDDPQS